MKRVLTAKKLHRRLDLLDFGHNTMNNNSKIDAIVSPGKAWALGNVPEQEQLQVEDVEMPAEMLLDLVDTAKKSFQRISP